MIYVLLQRFNISIPTLSPWRRSITGDLTAFFNFADDAYDVTWPDLPSTVG
jgi:phospholipase C